MCLQGWSAGGCRHLLSWFWGRQTMCLHFSYCWKLELHQTSGNTSTRLRRQHCNLLYVRQRARFDLSDRKEEKVQEWFSSFLLYTCTNKIKYSNLTYYCLCEVKLVLPKHHKYQYGCSYSEVVRLDSERWYSTIIKLCISLLLLFTIGAEKSLPSATSRK